MKSKYEYIKLIIVSVLALGSIRSCGKASKFGKNANRAKNLSKFRHIKSSKPLLNAEDLKIFSHLNNLNNLITLAQKSNTNKTNTVDTTKNLLELKIPKIHKTLETDSIKYLNDLECYIPKEFSTRYYFNRKYVLLYSNPPQFIRICKVDKVNRKIPQVWHNNGHGVNYMLRSSENITSAVYEGKGSYSLSFYLKTKRNLYQIYYQEKNVLVSEEPSKLEYLLQVIHHIHSKEEFKQ